MKYFNSIVVAIAAVTVYADTPDLTGSLEFIANPQMDRWPNSALPRACLDLQFYQGRLFNGGGEVESNPGAPWISSIDPYDNSTKFEFDPGTEAIANYLVTSWGDLLTPSQDPHEGDANLGHVFSRNPEGVWNVFKSVGGSVAAGTGKTVANNTHCWDMEEFDGRIFVSCYNLQSSTDHCKTFTACSPITDAYHSIGYCYAYTSGAYTCIDSLLVDRHYRHRNIASTLIRYVIERSDRVMLHADEDDYPKEIYLKYGFRIVDRTYEYFKPLKKINDEITVMIDRPMGTWHPEGKNIFYEINYGYVKGLIAPDLEEQDVYVLDENKPCKKAKGRIIAILHRLDDMEDKWVIGSRGHSLEDIEKSVEFQEKYHTHITIM